MEISCLTLWIVLPAHFIEGNERKKKKGKKKNTMIIHVLVIP